MTFNSIGSAPRLTKIGVEGVRRWRGFNIRGCIVCPEGDMPLLRLDTVKSLVTTDNDKCDGESSAIERY